MEEEMLDDSVANLAQCFGAAAARDHDGQDCEYSADHSGKRLEEVATVSAPRRLKRSGERVSLTVRRVVKVLPNILQRR